LEIDPEGGQGPAWTEEPMKNRKYVTMCSFVLYIKTKVL